MWLPPALLLLSLSGCFPIHGPEAVRSPEWGSLMVQCRYDPEWETHEKWWCRGAGWSSCKILVRTTGSEEEVKKNRVSIRDNQRDHLITVTMEKLRRDDQDTYWCGIEKIGPDLGSRVNVTIGEEVTVVTPPGNLLSRTTANSHGSNIRTHYMLLVFVKVPILLILVGAILWLKGPQRVPEDQWEQPIHTNLSCDLTITQPLRPTDEKTLPTLDPIPRAHMDRGLRMQRLRLGALGLAGHPPCSAQLRDIAQAPPEASSLPGEPARASHPSR